MTDTRSVILGGGFAGTTILPGHVVAPLRQMVKRTCVCMVPATDIDLDSRELRYLGEGSAVFGSRRDLWLTHIRFYHLADVARHHLLKVPTIARKVRVFFEWNRDMLFQADIAHLGFSLTRRTKEPQPEVNTEPGVDKRV